MPMTLPGSVAFMAWPGIFDEVRRSPILISPFSKDILTFTLPDRAIG